MKIGQQQLIQYSQLRTWEYQGQINISKKAFTQAVTGRMFFLNCNHAMSKRIPQTRNKSGLSKKGLYLKELLSGVRRSGGGRGGTIAIGRTF